MSDTEHRISFHGVQYIIAVTSSGGTLAVDIEQEDAPSRWHGEFSSKYIEEITQKTGNFKRFAIFTKMLRSALEHESESVFVDLLTYSDLEVLKSRKAGGSNKQNVGKSKSDSFRASNKRYLILTYAVEFDRVHYPLPLAFQENPDARTLQRTVRRLRKELQTVRDAGEASHNDEEEATRQQAAMVNELQKLRRENARLLRMAGGSGSGRDAFDAAAAKAEIKQL
eukprot:g2170.t1